jgi:flagellar motor switch protein FliG
LRLLPESLTEDIAIRLVRIDRIQRTVLAEVEETLKREFVANFARGHDRNSVATMAEMLNRADKETVQRVMATLEAKEPQAALRIRRAMFTFEDLARIDPTTLPVLIAECRADRLPVALQGASREVRELFLGHMSERAANMLRQEIEMLPPQRRRVVEEAQAEIIVLAKRLAEEGRVLILGEEEDANFDE